MSPQIEGHARTDEEPACEATVTYPSGSNITFICTRHPHRDPLHQAGAGAHVVHSWFGALTLPKPSEVRAAYLRKVETEWFASADEEPT